MKRFVAILILILGVSCSQEKPISSINPVVWEKRVYSFPISDSLEVGRTYLSIYSHIYSETEHKTHPLTATVSMRNTSPDDTVIVSNASYYNTEGALLRSYFSKPIYLLPMETVEIVIDQEDDTGGSGANFIFDWNINQKSPEPIFEAVMISTYGQQGLSFTTTGKRIQ